MVTGRCLFDGKGSRRQSSAMAQDAFDRDDWQTVLDPHRLESHAAADLL